MPVQVRKKPGRNGRHSFSGFALIQQSTQHQEAMVSEKKGNPVVELGREISAAIVLSWLAVVCQVLGVWSPLPALHGSKLRNWALAVLLTATSRLGDGQSNAANAGSDRALPSSNSANNSGDGSTDSSPWLRRLTRGAANAAADSSSTAATGQSQTQQQEQSQQEVAATAAAAAAALRPPWYISQDEAGALQARIRAQDAGQEPGWQKMMDKSVRGQYTYEAYRRSLPNGLTEYRTITVSPATSPLELMEFTLDDGARRGWEPFLLKATILEQGDWFGAREQVVRWVRRFPFHFLSDREYLIARKAWATASDGQTLVPIGQGAPGTPLFAVTRSLEEHPALGPPSVLVRTTDFNSCWVCRAVPDPWGGSEPASEVVLLHSEDIKIPENLARMAVRMGMSGFVGQLTGGQAKFQRARRMGRGLDPNTPDPLAYGHDFERVAAEAAAAAGAVGPAAPSSLARPSHGVHGGTPDRQYHRTPSGGTAIAEAVPGGVTPGGGALATRRRHTRAVADDEGVEPSRDYGTYDTNRPQLPGLGGLSALLGQGVPSIQYSKRTPDWVALGDAPVSAQEALHTHPRRPSRKRRHAQQQQLKDGGRAVYDSPYEMAPAGPQFPASPTVSTTVAGAAAAPGLGAAGESQGQQGAAGGAGATGGADGQLSRARSTVARSASLAGPQRAGTGSLDNSAANGNPWRAALVIGLRVTAVGVIALVGQRMRARAVAKGHPHPSAPKVPRKVEVEPPPPKQEGPVEWLEAHLPLERARSMIRDAEQGMAQALAQAEAALAELAQAAEQHGVTLPLGQGQQHQQQDQLVLELQQQHGAGRAAGAVPVVAGR